MTFEEWWEKSEISSSGYVAAGCAWYAAQKAERERIKHIVEHVGLQGNNDAWFDCCDMIRERIGE